MRIAVARRARLVMAAILVAGATAATAHGYKKKSIEIIHPWTSERAEADGREAAVSMELRNLAKAPDRLLSATTTIAERAELRDSTGAVPAKGFEIPAGGKLELNRGTARVQLVGLRKKLIPYDLLPITLVFAKAGKINIEAMVEEASTPIPAAK